MTTDRDGIAHCCGCVVTREFCPTCGEFIAVNLGASDA